MNSPLPSSAHPSETHSPAHHLIDSRSTAINKSQGQTLSRVGVYLSEGCFAHGQLYVAASRVGLPSHIRFAVARDEATGEYRTRNVVWRDALKIKP